MSKALTFGIGTAGFVAPGQRSCALLPGKRRAAHSSGFARLSFRTQCSDKPGPGWDPRNSILEIGSISGMDKPIFLACRLPRFLVFDPPSPWHVKLGARPTKAHAAPLPRFTRLGESAQGSSNQRILSRLSRLAPMLPSLGWLHSTPRGATRGEL